MAEFGHVIRCAFNPNEYHKVDEAMARTPWYIRKTHEIIMRHKHRDLCLAYYFGGEDILAKDFPEMTKNQEPRGLKTLYEKVGRSFERNTKHDL